jgi:predicted MFS family arabinose efflux permease
VARRSNDPVTVRYRDLFGNAEYSGLYVADVLSSSGDFLGRLAIAALVFGRTGSVALTAAAFAVTYLPYLLGGAVLATLADRWPRKPILVAGDLIRAALVLLILVPGVPLLAALALLFCVELVAIPWGAARLAILADVLEGGRFAAGNALVAATGQALQVLGFAGGGLVVSLVGAKPGLAIDAVSYLVSAVILSGWVRRRAAPRSESGGHPHLWRDTLAGLRIVRDAAGMRRLFLLLVLGPAILITAEGLAIPYARQLGGSTSLAGLMMAAAPLGSVIGLALMGRLAVERRRALTVPSAVVVGLATALAGAANHAASVVGLLFAAGLCMGYMTTIQADIAEAIPPHARGRVFGLAHTALQLAQGVAVALAGVLAQLTQIGLTLLAVGLVGAGAVATVGMLGRRTGRRTGTSARPAGVGQDVEQPSG